MVKFKVRHTMLYHNEPVMPSMVLFIKSSQEKIWEKHIRLEILLLGRPIIPKNCSKQQIRIDAIIGYKGAPR